MLVFIDESGDPGFKLNKGSSAFFTIAAVIFETSEQALHCQQSLESLKTEMGLPERFEFHFHRDPHARRLRFLERAASERFTVVSFTLDKARAASRPPSSSDLLGWVCELALDGFSQTLDGARIVLDGSGDRRLRRSLTSNLRRRMSLSPGRIEAVKTGRSESDVLIQLADYAAGVVNRAAAGSQGADLYRQMLGEKLTIEQRLAQGIENPLPSR
jgi:hypothetical protein